MPTIALTRRIRQLKYVLGRVHQGVKYRRQSDYAPHLPEDFQEAFRRASKTMTDPLLVRH